MKNTKTEPDELAETRKKILQERSRLITYAERLEDAGNHKERTALFDAIRALDAWEKLARNAGASFAP